MTATLLMRLSELHRDELVNAVVARRLAAVEGAEGMEVRVRRLGSAQLDGIETGTEASGSPPLRVGGVRRQERCHAGKTSGCGRG